MNPRAESPHQSQSTDVAHPLSHHQTKLWFDQSTSLTSQSVPARPDAWPYAGQNDDHEGGHHPGRVFITSVPAIANLRPNGGGSEYAAPYGGEQQHIISVCSRNGPSCPSPPGELSGSSKHTPPSRGPPDSPRQSRIVSDASFPASQPRTEPPDSSVPSPQSSHSRVAIPGDQMETRNSNAAASDPPGSISSDQERCPQSLVAEVHRQPRICSAGAEEPFTGTGGHASGPSKSAVCGSAAEAVGAIDRYGQLSPNIQDGVIEDEIDDSLLPAPASEARPATPMPDSPSSSNSELLGAVQSHRAAPSHWHCSV